MRSPLLIAIGFFTGLLIGAGAMCLLSDPGDGAKSQSAEMTEVIPSDQLKDSGLVEKDGFEEAISREEFRRQQGQGIESTVEEVRDEEGLTAEERAAKFRREQPEQWKAIMQERDRREQARRAVREKRQNFLDTVDISLFNDEQRKVHQEFADAMAERNACREEIRVLREQGKHPSAELRRRMSAAEHALSKNIEAERSALFEATGRALGVEESALKELSATLSDIVDATGR